MTVGQTARGRLALIVVLGKFSRNVYRGSPLSYAQDDKWEVSVHIRQMCKEPTRAEALREELRHGIAVGKRRIPKRGNQIDRKERGT